MYLSIYCLERFGDMKITKKQLESLVESTIKEQRLNKNKPRIWLISKERSNSRESDRGFICCFNRPR